MTPSPPIPPPRVRAWLRAALDEWVRDGLVTPQTARAISERHGLDSPGRGAGPLLAAVLLGIGGLLIGGGVMALVAANWQEIPSVAKISGLFVLLLGLHAAAYQMLRSGRERLGHGLLLAACVVYGGGIGLMAQVFHISSSTGLAWLLWSAGALASAWAAGSTPSGLLALGLAAYWYLDHGHETRYYPAWVVVAAPFAMLAAFGGLARERGSRMLAGGAATVFAATLAAACSELGPRGSAWVAGQVAGGLLLWAGAEWAGRSLRDTVRVIGVAAMAMAAYAASFRSMHDRVSATMFHDMAALVLPVATFIAGLILLAVAWRAEPPSAARRPVAWLVLGGATCVALACLLPAAFGMGMDILSTLLGNVAVLLFAAGAIASGFGELRRANFWVGTALAVVVVLTRFLEYDTDLMVKGFAFIACGVLVIYAGIEYERWLKRRAAAEPAEEGTHHGPAT